MNLGLKLKSFYISVYVLGIMPYMAICFGSEVHVQ